MKILIPFCCAMGVLMGTASSSVRPPEPLDWLQIRARMIALTSERELAKDLGDHARAQQIARDLAVLAEDLMCLTEPKPAPSGMSPEIHQSQDHAGSHRQSVPRLIAGDVPVTPF